MQYDANVSRRLSHSLEDAARSLQRPVLDHVRRKVRSLSDAEDIAQESWLKASDALGVSAVGNMRAYLFRIARNLTIDHYRRNARRIEDSVPDEVVVQIADPMPTPESQVITRDELRRVDAMLRVLPERAREVYRLSRIEEMSFAEIGRKLGISRQSVQEQMVRVLLTLQLAADGNYEAAAPDKRRRRTSDKDGGAL